MSDETKPRCCEHPINMHGFGHRMASWECRAYGCSCKTEERCAFTEGEFRCGDLKIQTVLHEHEDSCIRRKDGLNHAPVPLCHPFVPPASEPECPRCHKKGAHTVCNTPPSELQSDAPCSNCGERLVRCQSGEKWKCCSKCDHVWSELQSDVEFPSSVHEYAAHFGFTIANKDGRVWIYDAVTGENLLNGAVWYLAVHLADLQRSVKQAQTEIHGRIYEHDGAFKCLDCGAMWGALPGKPEMPAQCTPLEAGTPVARLADIQRIAEVYFGHSPLAAEPPELVIERGIQRMRADIQRLEEHRW